MALRAFFLLSRLSMFETRHWDGTALPVRKCDNDDHIPYVRACMNQKFSPDLLDPAEAQLIGATARITTVRLKKLDQGTTPSHTWYPRKPL